RSYVGQWLASHGGSLEASFVLQSWLNAGGERELVGSYVGQWLASNGGLPESQFVLKSWLDAGGERELVRAYVGQWLEIYGEDDESDFVMRAWLQSGGEFALVRSPAERWLRAHREAPEAVHITKFLAKETDLPSESVSDILVWCRKFHSNEDALWRLTSLGAKLLKPELSDEVVAASRPVLETALRSSRLERQALVTLLFAKLGRAPELRARVAELFATWLRTPGSLDFAMAENPGALGLKAQQPSLLYYLRDLVEAHALDLTRDREVLQRLFNWVVRWPPEKSTQAREILANLSAPSGAGNSGAPAPAAPQPAA
ncbi:MAG: hypothetical protein ABUT39_23605, partial [Acidobacteriota bacterium]